MLFWLGLGMCLLCDWVVECCCGVVFLLYLCGVTCCLDLLCVGVGGCGFELWWGGCVMVLRYVCVFGVGCCLGMVVCGKYVVC